MMATINASAALLAVLLAGSSADKTTTMPAGLEHYSHRAVCKGNGHHCQVHHLVDRNGKPVFHVSQQGYGPADYASAYKLDTSRDPGATIGIVDAYGYSKLESDLSVYRSNYGLPACTKANGCLTIVNQQGKTSPLPADSPADCQNGDWTEETALDVQMASAACPKCKLLVVLVDNDQDLTNLFIGVNTAASLGATVISNSWGAAEGSVSQYSNGNSVTALEAYMNHPGIAVFVASGDDGYNDGGQGPDFPGTARYVTAVGGTTLNKASNSRGWSETAWSDNGSGGAGGSACSTVVPKPSWQTNSPCGKKATADVSAVADMQVAIYNNGPSASQCGGGGWTVIGGTSAASPLVAGIYALTGNGGTDPSFAYSHTSGFFDITSGNNGSCGTMTALCNARVGWDGPTGIGTPNGAALVVTQGSPDGSACTSDATCQNSHCVGGVCCNSACDATCNSCSTGKCTPVNGQSCGDLCVPATCSNGACVPGTAVDCGPATAPCMLAPSCDPATGTCKQNLMANGTACDDGNACTDNDVCMNGTCQGTATQSACPAEACHEAGVCDPATGTCNASHVPDGTSCNDGDPCTQNDQCVAGVCGGAPVVCAAPDACHVAATCITGVGCPSAFPNAADGTPCDDGNLCTSGDTCLAGACAGTPIACAETACRGSGQCDPSTGRCDGTPKADGTSCDDGNACTSADSCVAGECHGTLKVCPAPAACHQAGVCDWQTGDCNYMIVANGTACDDGDPTTTGDTCQNGHCIGTPASTANDCAGKADGTVCASGTCKAGACVTPSATGGCSSAASTSPLPVILLALGGLLIRRRRTS